MALRCEWIAMVSTGRGESFDGLEDLDQGGVHFSPVETVGGNNACVWSVVAVDLLLYGADLFFAAISGQEHELLHG